MRRRHLLTALLLASAACVHAAPSAAEQAAAEQARIERLIAYVESQTTIRFVRNGSAYSSADAAKFLRGKYKKMGEHVNTAQQFIEQIASKSSTTGEAYLIRYPDGHQVPAARFLGDELQRMDR
jgi:hypothetical protein